MIASVYILSTSICINNEIHRRSYCHLHRFGFCLCSRQHPRPCKFETINLGGNGSVYTTYHESRKDTCTGLHFVFMTTYLDVTLRVSYRKKCFMNQLSLTQNWSSIMVVKCFSKTSFTSTFSCHHFKFCPLLEKQTSG